MTGEAAPPSFLPTAEMDALITDLGRFLANDTAYRDRPWTAIIVISEHNSQYGYVFWDGGWKAELPDRGWDFMDMFGELNRQMAAQHAGWQKARIRVRRAPLPQGRLDRLFGKPPAFGSPTVDVSFDYAGDQWPVTPGDVDGMIARLFAD